MAEDEEASKTKLMYGGFISYEQMKSYLPFIIRKGLLSLNTENGLYALTPQGKRFLKVYGELEQMSSIK
jgi:predicted transcriptional regulator